MALETHGTVTIAATPATVFAWLVEPAKLTAWLGAPGGMPEDSSELHAGWTTSSTMGAPGGAARPITVTITEYAPPQRMSMTVTYDGGRSISTYVLIGHGATTDLTLDADTDFAAADTSAVDTALTGQPAPLRWLAKVVLFVMKRKLARGDFDDATEVGMNSSVQESLAKLKGLVEAAAQRNQ